MSLKTHFHPIHPMGIALAGAWLVWSSCGVDPNDMLQNSAPIARFEVTPSEGSLETEFLFDANSSTDLEDDPNQLRIRWDWESDGTWDTPYSSTRTQLHRLQLMGTNVVSLEVIDSDGAISQSSQGVPVLNTPPTVSFSVTPHSGGFACTEFQVSISADDLEDGPADLLIRVLWGDGSVDALSNGDRMASHMYSLAGDYVIILEAEDTKQAISRSAESMVTTIENELPSANLTVAAIMYCAVDLVLVLEDCEHDPPVALIRWDWEGDGTWDTGYRPVSGKRTLQITSYKNTGTYLPTVEIYDGGDSPFITRTAVTISMCP